MEDLSFDFCISCCWSRSRLSPFPLGNSSLLSSAAAPPSADRSSSLRFGSSRRCSSFSAAVSSGRLVVGRSWCLADSSDLSMGLLICGRFFSLEQRQPQGILRTGAAGRFEPVHNARFAPQSTAHHSLISPFRDEYLGSADGNSAGYQVIQLPGGWCIWKCLSLILGHYGHFRRLTRVQFTFHCKWVPISQLGLGISPTLFVEYLI